MAGGQYSLDDEAGIEVTDVDDVVVVGFIVWEVDSVVPLDDAVVVTEDALETLPFSLGQAIELETSIASLR